MCQTFLSKMFAISLDMQKHEKNVWEKSDDAYLLSIQKRLSSYLYLNIDVQVNVFFRTQTTKGVTRQTDMSSVLWTLINNGKLANQIARLVAIVSMSTGLSNRLSIIQITVQYGCISVLLFGLYLL